MELKVRPRKEVHAAHAAMDRSTPAPEFRNVDRVFELDGEAYVPIRRKGKITVVCVPPVPYRDGLRIASLLADFRQVLSKIDAGDDRASLAKLQTIVPQLEAAIRRCIYPVTGGHWLFFWRGRLSQLLRLLGLWNPLRGSTLEEVASLAGFLLRRQTTPRIG